MNCLGKWTKRLFICCCIGVVTNDVFSQESSCLEFVDRLSIYEGPLQIHEINALRALRAFQSCFPTNKRNLADALGIPTGAFDRWFCESQPPRHILRDHERRVHIAQQLSNHTREILFEEILYDLEIISGLFFVPSDAAISPVNLDPIDLSEHLLED